MVLLQVLRFFPRYDDDADNFSGHHTSQQLRPWVNKLLQLGIADLRGLQLNGDIIAYPKVLGRLPLRHLELDIGGCSMAHLEEIMAALDQCTTLEYLSIAHLETCKLGFTSVVELPDLCLCKAPNLKHVYLQDSVPRKRLCLPPECKVRLNLDGHFESWEYIMQKKHGRILRACISVMHLKLACCYKGSWLSHLQDFKALQFMELVSPQMLSDLAQLDGIPHVRLEVGIMLGENTLLHTAGSWQSLEVCGYDGFSISFADIDSFVGSNHKYLFISHKATKAWRGMRDSLDAARKRQGVSFFKHDRTDGSYETAKLSSIPEMISSKDAHLVCVKELWPEECMWSCLHPTASELRGGQLYYSSSSDFETGSGSNSDPEAEAESKTESESDSDSETDPESETGSESGASLGSQASVDLSDYCTALSEVDREHHAKRLPFWGCLTWHDATSTIDGAQYDGNPQLQRLYEVCSFIGHGSREDYMTWSDV